MLSSVCVKGDILSDVLSLFSLGLWSLSTVLYTDLVFDYCFHLLFLVFLSVSIIFMKFLP